MGLIKPSSSFPVPLCGSPSGDCTIGNRNSDIVPDVDLGELTPGVFGTVVAPEGRGYRSEGEELKRGELICLGEASKPLVIVSGSLSLILELHVPEFGPGCMAAPRATICRLEARAWPRFDR
jgi:hypothetical protein